MELTISQFLHQNFGFILTSTVLIGVNYGVIKTQMKNKIDRVEAAELIDNKIAMHASNQTSYSNVSGARLETKVENIEKKLTTVESDVKEILKRVG